MKKIFTVSFFFLISIIYSGYGKCQVANDARVLLQGFYWDCNVGNEWYNIINSHAQEIADAGFDMIWLPPPSKATSGMGYLPTELNNLSNNFGSYTEHQAMINTLNNLGLEPIADIVINHRAGSTNWLDFTNPSWGTSAITSNDEVWNESAYSGISDRGAYDTGENYEAARDIDHSQQWVRNEIITWLKMLKEFGYKGWRYDLVKGYDPAYIKEYNDATSPSFSVGEYYDFNKQSVQDWIDGTLFASTAFDFPTYSTVKAAIKDNNYSYLAYEDAPSGLISWSPANSTTFIENHDTPRYDTDNNVLTSNNVGMAYAYLLTHPGVPTIYWPHWNDWGVKEEISTLIKIRKSNGLHSQSIVSIQQATANVYAAIIDDKVAVKIGSGDWSPSDVNYTLVASGNNYAIWSNSSESNHVEEGSLTLMWQTSISIPYLYYWNLNGNSNNPVAWPGTLMTASESFPGWYECTISGSSANTIFNDGNGTQTADLENISDIDCNTSDKRVWWDGSQWIDNNCTTYATISFNANGGTGSMTDVTVESGTTMALTANEFSMFGYLFSGWCDTSDGSGSWYIDEEEITTTEDLTLYAQWSITTQVNRITENYNFYPNPAKDFIRFDGIESDSRIILFNINGVVVFDQIVNINQVNLSHLPNGIYILSINNKLQKLTIQK